MAFSLIRKAIGLYARSARGAFLESDHIYFSRRAHEEREAAMKAPHPAARNAHLGLAARYDELAEAISNHTAQLNGHEADRANC